MVKFNELYIDDTAQNLIIDVSILNLPYYNNEIIKGIYLIPEFNYNEGSVEGAVWKVTRDGEGDEKMHLYSTQVPKLKSDNAYEMVESTENVRVMINQNTLSDVLLGDVLGYDRDELDVTDEDQNGVDDNYESIKWKSWDQCSENTLDDLGRLVSITFKNHLFFVFVETENRTPVDVPCPFNKKYTIGAVFYKGIIVRNFMQGVKEIESTCKIPKYFIDQHLRLLALEAAIDTDNFREAIKIYNSFFNMSDSNNTNVQSCNCGR